MSIVYQMASTSSAKTTGAAQTAGTGSKGATAGAGDFCKLLPNH